MVWGTGAKGEGQEKEGRADEEDADEERAGGEEDGTHKEKPDDGTLAGGAQRAQQPPPKQVRQPPLYGFGYFSSLSINLSFI